ncbi:MAG: RlmE family RNA methyltransferase [Bdellovibrionales bacterium]|nr:RlmE family RNA methyltransferase [Bdellovibrionales bacterium]
MTYNRKDHFYAKAKAEGFRSRAAYKLMELDTKYKLLRPGKSVLDLGCWPGGWTQVAAKKVGPSGKVVGVDLTRCDPLPYPQVSLIEGDARDDETIREALSQVGGKFDLIISDMSPKHTGIKEVDQAGTAQVVELAYWVGSQILKPGGALLVKAFPSGDLDRFIPELRGAFSKFHRIVLKSTRKSSKEFYICCVGFKGAPLQAESEVVAP